MKKLKIKDIDDYTFDDFPTTEEDVKIAHEIARVIGDLWLNPNLSPVDQWLNVVKALRIHELKIIEDKI